MKKYIVLIAALIFSGCIKYLEDYTMSVNIIDPYSYLLLSGDQIWIDVQGSKPVGVTNYQLLLKVESVDGALEGAPFTDAAYPDKFGLHSFNIQARIEQDIDFEFEYPVVTKTNNYDQLAFDIRLYAGETYLDSTGTRHTNWSSSTENHLILPGGTSRCLNSDINFLSGNNYLTHLPETTKVSPIQPVKLWFPETDFESSPIYTLRIAVHYQDGHVENKEGTIEPVGGSLAEINLLPELWDIETESSTGHGYATHMVVGLWNGNETLKIQERTYIFDQEYKENNTFVFYKTSGAGIDCLWCSGKTQMKFLTATDVATRPDIKENASHPERPTQIVSSLIGQRSWAINTGYKSKDELSALRDFALSDKMWMADGDSLVPVILENSEIILNDISRNLDDLDIVLTEAHIEKYY